MSSGTCFHCGLLLPADVISFDEKRFCCEGCKTVYELFSASDMSCYYDFAVAPGASPTAASEKYGFLSNAEIASSLLDFQEGDTAIVTLRIPHIHCSSCIWILENLSRLDAGVRQSTVNFPKKNVRILFDPNQTTLERLVGLLCGIGYEPYISLENYKSETVKKDRSDLYKLAVAFFSFGNIMLLSFPEYFELHEYWLDQYRGFFRLLIFLLALPSFLYSASGYYMASWKSIRTGRLTIEIPIALGIIVMFVRSVADMLLNHGPGFFDSMCGLIFFMLLGRAFQTKTFQFLNFERDYRSYFPVAVTRIVNGQEESVPVDEIRKGDRLLIRNQELIPADAVLISPTASIDYSFVTGEALPVRKASGDKLFAGGRQCGVSIEMEVVADMSQSYLTSLWANEVFQKQHERAVESVTDRVSRYFTPALLVIAFGGFFFWMGRDLTTAFNVFTAVLIVACPCALALTAPFTLGNILRILGRRRLYLKNARVIEQLASVDTIIFDKTGTITASGDGAISYDGRLFSEGEKRQLASALKHSQHPLSRMLYTHLATGGTDPVSSYEEHPGKGIRACVGDVAITLGSALFVGAPVQQETAEVHVAINGTYAGRFRFAQRYRESLEEVFTALSARYQLGLLSGDNEGERERLENLLPKGVAMRFNQTPQDKLEYIRSLQSEGRKVLMVGDGLNDAGALAQSNVGISITEDVNIFSPACDGILDAADFAALPGFLSLSRKAMWVITMSFGLSLLYNVVGLSYALSGHLYPLVAAIIMPLSTVTIVSFVTIVGNAYARSVFRKKPAKKTLTADNYHFSGLQPNLPLK